MQDMPKVHFWHIEIIHSSGFIKVFFYLIKNKGYAHFCTSYIKAFLLLQKVFRYSLLCSVLADLAMLC